MTSNGVVKLSNGHGDENHIEDFTTNKSWSVARGNLTLQELLYSGSFSRVYKAGLRGHKSVRDVCAKLLKEHHNSNDTQLMMAKINFAATQVGDHRNVLGFIGAVVNDSDERESTNASTAERELTVGPVLLTEYCDNGRLDKWLTACRTHVDTAVLEKVESFALEVARGMEYLAGRGIVHGDLSARNCLLSLVLEVKITGFGPRRATPGDENKQDGRKWTAPECISSMKKANEKSDVWSYGITLWEILSLGELPYSDTGSQDFPARIRDGYRLSRPSYAHDIHYNLMRSCWQTQQVSRPTFRSAVKTLEAASGLISTSSQPCWNGWQGY